MKKSTKISQVATAADSTVPHHAVNDYVAVTVSRWLVLLTLFTVTNDWNESPASPANQLLATSLHKTRQVGRITAPYGWSAT